MKKITDEDMKKFRGEESLLITCAECPLPKCKGKKCRHYKEGMSS